MTDDCGCEDELVHVDGKACCPHCGWWTPAGMEYLYHDHWERHHYAPCPFPECDHTFDMCTPHLRFQLGVLKHLLLTHWGDFPVRL